MNALANTIKNATTTCLKIALFSLAKIWDKHTIL